MKKYLIIIALALTSWTWSSTRIALEKAKELDSKLNGTTTPDLSERPGTPEFPGDGIKLDGLEVGFADACISWKGLVRKQVNRINELTIGAVYAALGQNVIRPRSNKHPTMAQLRVRADWKQIQYGKANKPPKNTKTIKFQNTLNGSVLSQYEVDPNSRVSDVMGLSQKHNPGSIHFFLNGEMFDLMKSIPEDLTFGHLAGEELIFQLKIKPAQKKTIIFKSALSGDTLWEIGSNQSSVTANNLIESLAAEFTWAEENVKLLHDGQLIENDPNIYFNLTEHRDLPLIFQVVIKNPNAQDES